MSSPIAEKIKQTKNSFPSVPPGAVAPCPYAAPEAPEAPMLPVDMKSAYALTQDITRSAAGAQRAEEKKPKTAWIEIILVDAEGKPVPGVRYRVTTPDGKVNEGTLNEHGQAGFYQIDPGNCKVTFPDLDKDAWD